MARAMRLAASCFLAAAPALAEPVPAEIGRAHASAVELYVPPCANAPLETERLLELLRIELGAIGVGDVRAGGAPRRAPAEDLLAAVVVSWPDCESGAREMTIKVVDRATSKTVERTMAVSDVPYAERPRALAIAIAELLQASWAELDLAPRATLGVDVPPELRASIVQRLSPPPTAPPVAPEHPPLPPASARRRGLAVEAAALLRAFPARDTGLLGGAVALSVPFAKMWALQFGADGCFGESHVAQGTVDVVAATASAGVSVVTGGPTELELGPRLHAGYAWADGTPQDPSQARGGSYSHFVALAALSSTLRVPASGWAALVGLDVGYVLAETAFLVDGARAAGVGGVAFGARLGASLGI